MITVAAFVQALALGRAACAAMATAHGWQWPATLADRLEWLLAEQVEQIADGGNV